MTSPRALDKTQQHDKFAGLLGIQPQGIREIYTHYIHQSESDSKVSIHQARKTATRVLQELRMECMELSYQI